MFWGGFLLQDGPTEVSQILHFFISRFMSHDMSVKFYWLDWNDQINDDSLVTNVLLGERDVLDQHGRLRAEEDSQHRLEESTSERLNKRPGDPAEATGCVGLSPWRLKRVSVTFVHDRKNPVSTLNTWRHLDQIYTHVRVMENVKWTYFISSLLTFVK